MHPILIRLMRIGGLGALALTAGVAVAPAGHGPAYPPLQPLIDAAQAGDTVRPPPGTYAGPLTIAKPIVLDGGGQVTLDGGGHGTVLTLSADGATVRGMRIVSSGGQHSDDDSCILVDKGGHNVVRDNVLNDCLFGVNVVQSHGNIIRRNYIASRENLELGIRGDAVRLWYSNRNRVEGNEIEWARDLVVWYSEDNVFADNEMRGGRYALHSMFAGYNLVERNRFIGNTTGVFLMYSDGVIVRGNQISHGQGPAGVGVGLKESSNVVIEDNEVVYCATGIYIDVSPYDPEAANRIVRNRIAFSGIGILFHNDWTGNHIVDNRFESNALQVSVNARASARRNHWEGNYWDDYEGFDRNGDGMGDTPHRIMVYADRLWMDVPHTAFFRGSPSLTFIDFLERLAPFTEPILMLADARPRIRPEIPRPAAKVEERFDPFGLYKPDVGK
jgi:nitrous oxidase accessory protein